MVHPRTINDNPRKRVFLQKSLKRLIIRPHCPKKNEWRYYAKVGEKKLLKSQKSLGRLKKLFAHGCPQCDFAFG